MKTFRLFGVLTMAIMLCFFTSCGDDDDDDQGTPKSLIIGKWNIDKIVLDGKTIEWDGYPYFVITETHTYFTDDEDIDKSDYCTYTYNESTGVISMKYVNNDTQWSLKVLKVNATEAQIEGDIDLGKDGIIYCTKVK